MRHLGELAKARATRRSSERADGQALAELETRPLALPAGLEVEWLGVSGYRVSYEGTSLFVDRRESALHLGHNPLPVEEFLIAQPTHRGQRQWRRHVAHPGEEFGDRGHTHILSTFERVF